MKCKKCRKKIDHRSKEQQEGEYWGIYSHYCNKCANEFKEVENSGAIILRRRCGRDSHIYRWEIYQKVVPEGKEWMKAEAPVNTNQVNVIKRGIRLGRKYNVPVLFLYEPKMSLWFLEDYLNAHPNIKKDVEKYFLQYLVE